MKWNRHCVGLYDVYRCHGGSHDAAWEFYRKVGLVTGGNYNSQQVQQ